MLKSNVQKYNGKLYISGYAWESSILSIAVKIAG